MKVSPPAVPVSRNVTLLSHLDSYNSYSAGCGYVHADGREYACIGTDTGTADVAPSSLVIAALNIAAVSTQPFAGVVAIFNDFNPAGTPGDFSATIAWGDGTTTDGVIRPDAGGGYEVFGTKTFAQPGILGTASVSEQTADAHHRQDEDKQGRDQPRRGDRDGKAEHEHGR